MIEASNIIDKYCNEVDELRRPFFKDNLLNIEKAALKTALSFASGGKLFLCAQGMDALFTNYLAALFIQGITSDKPALPAYILSDKSITPDYAMSCMEQTAFVRQLDAYAAKGDMFVAFAGSEIDIGLKAGIETARAMQLELCIFVCDTGGLSFPEMSDAIKIPYTTWDMRAEIYLSLSNIFYKLVDYYLYTNVEVLNTHLIFSDHKK